MATQLKITKPCGRKILYVCPATMVGNVAAEAKRWSPHRTTVDMGSQPKLMRKILIDAMQKQDEFLVVINYEAWRKDMQLLDDLIRLEFDTCIIDEAHNVKDRKSIAYRGLHKLIVEGGIPFVFPMTGSPILNRPQELFSLLSLVKPNVFHTERYFLQDYCEQDYDTGKWGFRPGGMDSLAKRIAPYFLRRTKEQAGIELPPKTIIHHPIDIDEETYKEQANVREQMRKWASIIIGSGGEGDEEKAISAAAVIAQYTRLRQIETWPDGIQVIDPLTKEVVLKVECGESQKIDYIIKPGRVSATNPTGDDEGLLPEIISDDRAVVFSQFKEPLREIQRRCNKTGIRSIVLDGDTSYSDREKIRVDFDARTTPDRKESTWDVVLCNYKVGGIGLNFTAATQMIILDEEWNPGKRDQAYDRIHRIGQDKPVTIHVLRMVDPKSGFGIDTWLAGLISDKEDMVSGFNSATDMAAEMRDALRKGLI